MVLGLLAAACGGKAAAKKDEEGVRAVKGESGLADAGKPVRGGRLVYGLESESTGGWCLPESTLAISGNMVRWAIYDPLTILNDKGVSVPYLAKSVTPNATNTEFTIVLRDGVKFHDGTDLTADVVKDNIEAFNGTHPPRKPTLWPFVLRNLGTVTVKNNLTLVITTKVPWVSFPLTLAGIGIMGRAQLDDPTSCDRNLIGTGPFKLSTWRPNEQLIAQRNPDYWQMAPDGKRYPYVDAIEFRPIPEAQQRINAIQAGEINVMLTSTPADITGSLRDLRNQGDINLLVSEDHAEVNYVMFNVRKAPFDDKRMRQAVAYGLDRNQINEIVNGGFPTIADQPFPPGDPGYVKDPGFPEHDEAKAKALVKEYVGEGKSASFTLSVSTEPLVLARAEVIQNELRKVGISVKIHSTDQSTLINEAVGGKFEGMTFRGFAGPNPDTKYTYWYKGSPINFGGFDDPVINEALDEGRGEPDAAKRRAIYERISKSFSSEVWDVWLNYTPWAVAESKDVHGIHEADLPDNGGRPFTGLASGHPLLGMWIDSGK